MKVTICVGSTCHLLGSRTVVDRFKALVEEHRLADRVELSGKRLRDHRRRDPRHPEGPGGRVLQAGDPGKSDLIYRGKP